MVDDSTIKVHLASPAPAFITNISNAIEWTNPISPESYKKQGKDAFQRNPVGAGPFKFVEWRSGQSITLEKNPNYWRKAPDGQPFPYLDKIVYRLIIDDLSAARRHLARATSRDAMAEDRPFRLARRDKHCSRQAERIVLGKNVD